MYECINWYYRDALIVTHIAFWICVGYQGLTWQRHSLQMFGLRNHLVLLFRRGMYESCNDVYHDSGRNVV